MMAMTCKGMIPIVKQSSCFNNVEYTGELVGPDVAPGRDGSKESMILIDRKGTFEPKVRVLFQYGHDHEDGYCYKMQWSVPLLLSEVMNKFYKPPGWKEAAEIELLSDKIPYRKTFPLDKYPIAPVKMRAAGQVRFVASKSHSATFLKEGQMRPSAGSYEACSFEDLTKEIPAGLHVTVTCSTGIEEFPSGKRAHYLSDLELGLCGALPPALFDHPGFAPYVKKMGLNRAEPPDLWYRWLPEEARKIAGYRTDPSAIERMINPNMTPKKPAGKLTKLNMLRESTDFMLEEWDPSARSRQKREARERTRAHLRELGRRETAGTEGPEHMLPYAPPELEAPYEAPAAAQEGGPDEAPAAAHGEAPAAALEEPHEEHPDDARSDVSAPHEPEEGPHEAPAVVQEGVPAVVQEGVPAAAQEQASAVTQEEPHEEHFDDALSAVSSLGIEDALEMLENLQSPESPEAGPSELHRSVADFLSDEEIERRVRNVGKAGIQRERETLKDRLDRLNAERDEALAQLQKIGKRRREE